jgi:hypothetical protein
MPKLKIDGIQMAVKIAWFSSLTTNHKKAETTKETKTAAMIKKSDRLNTNVSLLL